MKRGYDKAMNLSSQLRMTFRVPGARFNEFFFDTLRRTAPSGAKDAS
jgi:hypothetical protein